MLKISANDAQLTVVACGPITSDRIDLPCEITLSKEFDGLAVTVVFKAGDVQRDVAMLGSPVHVPAECLEQAGEVLMVGIWAGDGSGRPTIPTVWASAGTIRTGVLPSGYDPDEPEPDWAAQVQQAAAQAVATANSVRADADAGVFDGADGYSPTATVEQLADGATITITDKDGTTTATVHDGTDGRDGTDGVDGFSPTATVTQTATGATISITDKSGTTTASVSNGTDGTDGTDGFSPTVDVQAITGGHEVTITDADGAHSFDVLDGDPAEPGSITDAMLAPDGIKAQVAQLFGNQLTGTLSGTVDTASDAYAAPPMALTVEGSSTQAGTPTPDAPVPILSVDALELVIVGKNLFDKTDVVAGTYINSSGQRANGSANTSTNFIPIIGGETYTVSFESVPGGGNYLAWYTDADQSTVTGSRVDLRTAASTTATAPSDAKFVRFSFKRTLLNSAQLEVGSTATAYEPYQGQSVPLYDGILRSLPDGTKDELHLSYLRPSTREGWAWYSREVTRNVGHVADMGELTWTLNSTNGYFTARIDDMNQTTTSRLEGLLCTAYGMSSTSGLTPTSPEDKKMMRYGGMIVIRDSSYSTAADFKAALDASLSYQLANPVTTQLDPIELPELPAPNCTVFCDGGSAQPTYSMQYVQDTNLVIAELRAALADLATS